MMVNEDNKLGKLISDRYRIRRMLGDGASCCVYLADDTQMHRPVALKLLAPDQSELSLNTRAFDTEVEAITKLSRIHNDHIVEIYDVCLTGSREKYIVMEYVEGATLRQYLDSRLSGGRMLPVNEVINCAEHVLLALRTAHREGIVHRDIKPQNVLLTPDGQLKVTDFGIAKLQDVDRFQLKDRAIGTVQYISPEQASGQKTDARSDLYSLGIMMYELATGKLPFDGNSPDVVAQKQITDAPVPPSKLRHDIPVGLEQIILCALEKDPADRFRSADAMLTALNRVRKDPAFIFPVSPADMDAPPPPSRGIQAVTGITQILQKPVTMITNKVKNRPKKQKKPHAKKQKAQKTPKTRASRQLAPLSRTAMIIIAAAVALLLIAAIVVIIVIGVTSAQSSAPQVPTELPAYPKERDRLDEDLEALADRLWDDGYTLSVIRHVYSESVPAGSIVEITMDEEANVTIVVSDGQQQYAPYEMDLSGNYEDVLGHLRKFALDKYQNPSAITCNVTYETSTVKAGDIIEWHNAETGDHVVTLGCTLEFRVSASDAYLLCQLIGTNYSTIYMELNALGVTPLTVTGEKDASHARGTVIRITLPDGTPVTPDMTGEITEVNVYWAN